MADTPLWLGITCLSLAMGFEEDQARLGLTAAVERLRDALAYNRLNLDTDERLFARVLDRTVSEVELAESICSPRRMAFAHAVIH